MRLQVVGGLNINFNVYLEDVARTLSQIKEENALNLYYYKKHLAEQTSLIIKIISLAQGAYQIGIQVDKETLLQLLALGIDELRDIMSKWLQEKQFKDRKSRQFIVVKLCLKTIKASKTIDLSIITDDDDANLLYQKTFACRQDIETVKDSIAEFQRIAKETENAIDLFIESESFLKVKEYFDDQHASKVKNEILNWLRDRYTFKGVLFELDFREPQLCRQLFTHPSLTAYKLLTSLQGSAEIFKSAEQNTLFEKKRMIICCKSERNSYLTEKEKELFTNIEKYKELTKVSNTVSIDVCRIIDQITCRDITLTALDKTNYSNIIEALKDREKLRVARLDAEDDAKIIAYTEKMKLEAQCQKSIESNLQAIIRSNTLPAKLIVENDGFLSSRASNMKCQFGPESSCKVINGCVNRTISKASERIQQKGNEDVYTGYFSLKRCVIPLAEVNDNTLPKEMKDPETEFILRDHEMMNINLSTLNCMYGNDCLSQSVVPCIANQHLYYANNIIVNHNTFVVNMDQVEGKKKRKRASLGTIEKNQKKFRLILGKKSVTNEIEEKEEEQEDPNVITLKVTSTRVDSIDEYEYRHCPVCAQSRKIKSFCDVQKKKAISYYYIKSVCNSCIVKWRNQNK